MNASITLPTIRYLSPITVTRIAAGEVIDRPASVIKELVENSLDAGSTEIVITVETGGKNFISVSDNGCGMDKDSLFMAVDRHATSKLLGDDLFNIKFFGFRGEALPSIGSVSRLTIKSRPEHLNSGWMITVADGEKSEAIPTSHPVGTTVEIHDLFYPTPVRLKFLRTEKTEVQHIAEIVDKISLAHPKVSFKLISDGKAISNYNASNPRLNDVIGKDFLENSIEISSEKNGVTLRGNISVPTYTRGTSNEQYLYVNNRYVRDKFLLSAVRVAYQDFISRDRHPTVVLFLEVPCELVDVNVHPSKMEVKFRDVGQIRQIVIGTIKDALFKKGHMVSSTIASDMMNSFRVPTTSDSNYTKPAINNWQREQIQNTVWNAPSANNIRQQEFRPENTSWNTYEGTTQKSLQEQQSMIQNEEPPLGFAKCQLHSTYIVSQTKDSIVIVDQHAAHERLVYEILKNQMDAGLIQKQTLLLPHVFEVTPHVRDTIIAAKDELFKLGLTIEASNDSIMITTVPHLLGECDVKKLFQDIVYDIIETEQQSSMKELVQEVLATYACHHSIRAGRTMRIDEMNAMLREMEATPHSGQCNHGRPTYIELKLKDIEKLFGRV